MPDREQQVKRLSERVVKEAVGVGMESSMREPIVEAVEEAGGTQPAVRRQLPLAGVFLGIGAAIGYLAGREEVAEQLGAPDLESVEEPEIVEEVTEEFVEEAEEEEAEPESGSRRLPRLALVLALVAAGALARRRLMGEEEEEWEPIEEFEPAVDQESEEEAEMEAEDEGEAEEEETEE
ncbi:hypothetical protein [Salinilacihabitans rarus]|uniref:hypothetical protein n=1 Tax=Salinilacihabitans rarus TaxID=2961596 RepID=UPI0020C93439|nr:hypothetical protein [Salinilacihabitans rarus]